MIAAPPAPDAFLSHTVKQGTVLERIAIDNAGATEFSYCHRACRRFGPFKRNDGTCVPTLYAGSDYTVGLMEVCFHDVDLTEEYPIAYMSDLRQRLSAIAPRRDLHLATLLDDALESYGIKRSEIIDTPPTTYLETAKWAAAIHASPSLFDGLLWNSRRHPEGEAFVLFGDRVSREDDLDVVREPENFRDSPGYDKLMEVATRFGITIIH